MPYSASELISMVRDQAGERETSTPPVRMLAWLNEVYRDFTTQAKVLRGSFCPGALEASGRYPLNQMYPVRTALSGTMELGGPNTDFGPYQLIPEAIYEVTWDRWGGSYTRERRVDRATDKDWLRWTGGEHSSRNTANQPSFWCMEYGPSGAQAFMNYARLWPPRLTTALGTASVTGATLEFRAARYPLELVVASPSSSQSSSLECDNEFADTIVYGVLAKHYRSKTMPEQASDYEQRYYAKREEAKKKITHRFRGGRPRLWNF